MIINKKHVKIYTLAVADRTRAKKFSRISKEFLERADAALKNWIVREVQTHPSKGITIKILLASLMVAMPVCCFAGDIPKERAVNAIIGEAEGEPFNGKVAVACAIRNRGTLKGVYGEKSKRVVNKLYSKRVKEDAERAWRMSEEPVNCSFIDGADHWEGTAFPTPEWAENMKQTAIIGNQRFYRYYRESEEQEQIDRRYMEKQLTKDSQ